MVQHYDDYINSIHHCKDANEVPYNYHDDVLDGDHYLTSTPKKIYQTLLRSCKWDTIACKCLHSFAIL